MSAKQKKKLPKGKYKVFIDSKLEAGKLEMSHAILKGRKEDEILISSYVCHPSMANNELSGPVVLNAILDFVKNEIKDRQYTYRFILQPETIGSIAYLSRYSKELKEKTICGFNLSCVGDNRGYSFVGTPFKDTIADEALYAALFKLDNFTEYSFLKRGSDERQYCSPGLRLPVCTFSRTKFGCYPEYHTNADNLNVVNNEGLNGAFNVMKNIIRAFELGIYPKATHIGEPQFGKRKLHPENITTKSNDDYSKRINFQTYCDGKTSIFEICKLINCDLDTVLREYLLLKEFGLII